MGFDDTSLSKMDASAQRVIDAAISDVRRRHGALLTNAHIFLAFARLEWHVFSRLMRDVGAMPQQVVREVSSSLLAAAGSQPRSPSRPPEMRVAPATKLLFKLAFHHASRLGRQSIESIDLFSAIFEESQGVAASAIVRYGVQPEALISRIDAYVRESEVRAERRREQTTRQEPAPPTAPIAASDLFDEADRRWAEEEADRARAWPDPPRSLRRRLLDLMGFRARTKA